MKSEDHERKQHQSLCRNAPYRKIRDIYEGDKGGGEHECLGDGDGYDDETCQDPGRAAALQCYLLEDYRQAIHDKRYAHQESRPLVALKRLALRDGDEEKAQA